MWRPRGAKIDQVRLEQVLWELQMFKISEIRSLDEWPDLNFTWNESSPITAGNCSNGKVQTKSVAYLLLPCFNTVLFVAR